MPSIFFCLVISPLILLTWAHFRKEHRIPLHHLLHRGDSLARKCDLDDPEGCDPGYCCVKVVISFTDQLREPIMSTLCHPHLTPGQLCLRQPEGYLCDCADGLMCDFKNNETYGHCVTSKDNT